MEGSPANPTGQGEVVAPEEELTGDVLTPAQLDIEASITNDFNIFFSNFYEVVFIAAGVETRNWQMTVPVPPRTAYNIQFWLQQLELSYRWRALFAARGA